MSATNQDGASNDTAACYRSGVAARLAGLAVETLRVWERRYSLSETHRSEHGQRLYSAAQVRRLGLLKQLVDQGHPIGAIAAFPVAQLEVLLAAPALGQPKHSAPLRVVVVGESLRCRIAAGGRELAELRVLGSCDLLAQAPARLHAMNVDVLVVEVSELDDASVPLIIAARDAVGASSAVVLYRFCASATIRALRLRGCVVARVPGEMGELALLCRTAAAELSAAPLRAPIAAPRYDEAALAAYAAAGSRLQCECPRHLADLLMMVGSFERYSGQCASRNEADALLHGELEQAAAMARSVLEQAMERLVRAEGLDTGKAAPS